ncbi:hypothetical protein, partial [Escherichia coli]|uniref:hypothetical protein n=1 Tax=Escherichia coli TaxID=562 RepID=UPI003CF44EDC
VEARAQQIDPVAGRDDDADQGKRIGQRMQGRDGLRTRTDWPTLEILIADNDSRAPETLAYFRALEGEGVRVVACPGPFDFAG